MFNTRSLLKLFRNNRIQVSKCSTKQVPPNESSIKYLASRKWSTLEDSDESDKPIKYLSSPASLHTAKVTISGAKNERLWYEPHVITVSLLLFLIYFTMLREENDIDEELRLTLYDRIEGLEETQLQLSLAYNQANGLDTSAITKRLEELENKKKQSRKVLEE